jgi:hypothetical protein
MARNARCKLAVMDVTRALPAAGQPMCTARPSVRRSAGLCLLALAALLAGPGVVFANASLQCAQGRPCPAPPMSVWAPYPFYNGNVEYAAGVAFAAAGFLQPQFGLVANAFVSSNGTRAGFLLARDYRIGNSRFFADFSVLGGNFGQVRSFSDGNPDFPEGNAGSNDSDKDNYIEAEGTDLFVRLPVRYLLPIGAGRDEIVHVFRTSGGKLVPGTGTGGQRWNPFSGGRTFLEVITFQREQDLQIDAGGEINQRASGVTLRIQYDNTDWWNNPSEGSRTRLSITRDRSGNRPGDTVWTQAEAQYSKFWSLGESERAQARVLAFDAWLSDVPTWNSFNIVDGEPLYHRPPVYMGSTLGGLFRQRGYYSARFNDRSAINYALEYRHTTQRSLLAGIRMLDRFGVDFTQLVGFVEAGRVAPAFDLGELHDDMKLTFGAGFRASAQSLVVRMDLGASDEGLQVQMFVSHPF